MVNINTCKYKKIIKDKNLTYYKISQLINTHYNKSYTDSGVCRAVNGNTKSYSMHKYLCNILEIDIREVFTWN